MDENLVDPRINLVPGFAFEADAGAGFEKRLDLFQVQLLCFVHDGGQSSSCHPLQAHLALESHLPFRLILYWIRLRGHCWGKTWYNLRQSVRPASPAGRKLLCMTVKSPQSSSQTFSKLLKADPCLA